MPGTPRHAFMQAHEKACSVSAMYRELDVTRSCYGAPRLPLELWEEGWAVSRKWVAQRMRELGLRAGAARKCMAQLHREGMPS